MPEFLFTALFLAAPPIPSAEQLEIIVPANGTESRLVAIAKEPLMTVDSVTMALHYKIAAALKVAPERATASCKWFTRDDLKLKTCESKASVHYYTFELSIDDTPVLTGHGTAEPGREKGRVRYFLSSAPHVTRSSGTIEYAYEITGGDRTLRVELIEFVGPSATAAPVTATYEYQQNQDGTGRAVMSAPADLIHVGSDGRLWWGADHQDEETAVSLAWEPTGAGRAAGRSCIDGQCTTIRECWSGTGEVEFFAFGRDQIGGLGWSPEACPRTRISSLFSTTR